MSKMMRKQNTIGRSIRKSNDSDQKNQHLSQNNQKPTPVAEKRDEDIEEIPGKEFKKILIKFSRDSTKHWEEF